MLPDEEEGGNQNNVEPEMEENQEEFQDADTLVDENSEDKEGPEEPDLEETRNNPTNAWMSSPQQRGEPSNFSVRTVRFIIFHPISKHHHFPYTATMVSTFQFSKPKIRVCSTRS